MATRSALVVLAVATLAALPSRAPGQAAARLGPHPRWEALRLPWLGFSPNGVWRGRARQVRANRARLLGRRQFSALNSRAVTGATTMASTVVSGTIVEPVVMFKYNDTSPSQLVADTAAYDSVLFGATPPNGRPYTVRTYYEQLTTLDGATPLMTITGKSLGFIALDSNEVTYTGVAGTCSGNPFGTTNCNGLFSFSAYLRMQSGLREALQKLDGSVNWTQFSSHGDTIDLVVFVQPAKDGSCGGFPIGSDASNNHIWAHRATLETPYRTHSGLQVVDYVIESGVGGVSSCDTTQIMPVGTVAHETGHGFDLPDLYDTQGFSEGVGEYSLMGSGNYTSGLSPSRMDAWSLSQLGWVNVVPLPSSGTYSFNGAPVSDTAFYVGVTGANPRGEYFLLENRQPVQSDSAMIQIHCQRSRLSGYPSACSAPGSGGGLLIWHVDSTQMANHGFNRDNMVNYGPIHGLELVQADGRGDLDAGTNRGDAGDPYPGVAGNFAFSLNARPFPAKNADGTFAGFIIDVIQQVVPGGAMSFRLVFGAPQLSTQAVVGQLLTGTGLTPAELNYLDLNGNRNSLFDLGDFLAWVRATGAP